MDRSAELLGSHDARQIAEKAHETEMKVSMEQLVAANKSQSLLNTQSSGSQDKYLEQKMSPYLDETMKIQNYHTDFNGQANFSEFDRKFQS